MSDPLGPGRIFELDGVWTFLIDDFDAVMDVTDRHVGLQGGGYTWSALAVAIGGRSGTDLLAGLDVDPESDTFLVRSAERAPLERLADALEPYFTDTNLLTDLLAELGPTFTD
jgi:hypothetical protein